MLYEFEQCNWHLTSGFTQPANSDRIILMHGRDVLSKHGQYWQAPTYQDVAHLNIQVWEIAEYQQHRWYVARTQTLPHDFYAMEPRATLATSETAFALVSRAIMVQLWLEQNRFCGSCGKATTLPDQSELYSHCDSCKLRFYPRINPCVIGLVYRGDELLLAQGKRHKSGYYSVLAGFMEAGESAEQGLAREIFEESGVRIKNIRYTTSQVWPYPHQLMIGFIAEYDSGELTPQADEIVNLAWFHRDQLPKSSPNHSIAGYMIEKFVNGDYGV